MISPNIATRAFGRGIAGGIVLFLTLPGSAQLQVKSNINVGGSRIQVQIADGDWGSAKTDIPGWIRSAGESVTAYYGRFPIPQVRLSILPFQGDGIRHGTTYGDNGGYIVIHVGTNTTPAEFGTDWMLTHEMVHLAFPSVADDHHWIEEGIATYVEPIARVEAGNMDVKEMWFELVRDLPQGLPAPGDEGLDNTHTWANTYWGGARFCFLADIGIRRATKNRLGLQDALRGILNAGGDIRVSWDLMRALKIGDRATGVKVLVPLYEKMKDRPVQTDLPGLWKELGITRTGNTVTFDDTAPLASVREAITSGNRPVD